MCDFALYVVFLACLGFGVLYHYKCRVVEGWRDMLPRRLGEVSESIRSGIPDETVG